MDLLPILSNPILLTILAGSLILLVIALYIFSYLQQRSLKKLITKYAEHESSLVKDSQQAQSIIEDANKIAATILADTEAFKDAMQKRLSEVYEQALAGSKHNAEASLQRLDGQIQNFAQEIQNKHIEILQSIEKNIEASAQRTSEQYLQQMEQRVMSLAQKREQHIEEQLDMIQKDLDKYKEEQLQRINSNIYEILARASESVLGQAISLDLHQELIIRALEQAKREGAFI